MGTTPSTRHRPASSSATQQGAVCCGPAGSHTASVGAFHQALKAFLKVYQFRDRDRICCFDVSVTQSEALDVLVESGPATQNQLSAALYLDKSTTSRVIATLERKGYVRRTGHPNDGRAFLVEITTQGRKLHDTIEASLLEQQARMLATVPDELRAQMVELLRRMTATASAGISTAGGVCCVVD